MKSVAVKLPSFLADSQQIQKIRLQFKKKSVITLMDMVKQELGNTLNPKFIASHRHELQTPHFVIEAKNSEKEWKIIKRLTDIVEIQKQLKIKYGAKVPSVPLRKQADINQKNQNQLLQFFQVFMNVLAKTKQIRQDKQFVKFIGNFIPPQRKKMKIFNQIQLRKRAGGRYNQSILKRTLNYLTNWLKKYFTITSQGVYYTANDQDFRIQQMIPFTVGFKLLYGEAQTGYTYGVVLNSAHRLLNIDAQNIYNMTYFVYFIRKAMKENNYLSENRYHSFASVRSSCNANYIIDGKLYFSQLCDAMLSAKSQIFITGWMVSPFFCLKRPDPNYQTRLDKVLEKVATSGIKVHIIIYMEPKVALNLDSQFTEAYLTKLSPNIKVLRHPAYMLIPFLWTHHQKMVIIDQKLAFMGGLDLGYGRYDDSEHRLHDINEEHWPGVDYCNYRKTDILRPKQYTKCSIDRQKQPRMPWHDVCVKFWGQSVIDISRHFVQFWNYVNFQLNMDERQLLMYAGLDQQNLAQIKQMKQKNDQQSLKTKRQSFEGTSKRNKNYSQVVKVDPNQKNNLASVIGLDQQQLMMDHEQQLQFYANHMQQEQSKIDKFINKIKEKKNLFSTSHRFGVNFQQLIVTESGKTNKQKQEQLGRQNHQLLRSASMWSLGLGQNKNERSILEAYVQLIYHSKQFIYIENQFFISVENTVTRALVERISRAHEKRERFKVVVVLPALPGFDGQIYSEISAVLRVQVHYIYNTIFRGGKSMMEQLSFIENIGEYIQFFTLRTHGIINDKPVSQMIYVHSKLMIVDDEKVLIGSANINDRSLLGNRDSQIAIVIEDQETLQVKINNSKNNSEQIRKVRKFAHNLRVDLYMQHFGVKRNEIQDYHNEDSWWKMIYHADKNQQIYRSVFAIYPDNSIRTFKDIFKVTNQGDLSKYQLLKQLIKGHAILFQGSFLDEESLELKASQKEYYLPYINFT